MLVNNHLTAKLSRSLSDSLNHVLARRARSRIE
jgi:hypothetical protein